MPFLKDEGAIGERHWVRLSVRSESARLAVTALSLAFSALPLAYEGATACDDRVTPGNHPLSRARTHAARTVGG